MSKYQINELVVHVREGLSRILGISNLGENEFYQLKPCKDDADMFYVPVNQPSVIIRDIMSKQEADKIISYMKTVPNEYNSNTKQRRDLYKRKLNSGDVLDIAYLYCQLIHGLKNEEVRFGPNDLDMLNYAKNMLLDEFAISYKVKRDAVESLILKKLRH